MQLLIDNYDGLGGVDYTPALLRDAPLTITRRRGAWAVCEAGLDLLGTGLAAPADRARVLVLDASGGMLFRGVLQGSVHATVSEGSTTALQQKPRLRALEDSWLTQALPDDSLQPASASQHTVALQDVALKYDATGYSAAGKQVDLATDVTVSGAHEAGAYVTELFRGDGATQSFVLAHAPFHEAGAASLLDEQFDDSTLNTAVWRKTDTGSFLSLGSRGLRMGGGTGFDGATVLAGVSPVEMGGTLVAEATGVMLAAGSDGVLMGFYNGAVLQGNCVAGVRVRGSAGAHALVAVVNGVEQPASYSFAEGHRYALRVRLHCPEMQRLRAQYRARVDGVLHTFGGGAIDAPLQVVLEVVDQGLASSTLPTVLYDGAMPASPAQCVFAPVNSLSLVGSIGGVRLTQEGSGWVVSTSADGTRITRRAGPAGTGADYAFSAGGVVNFNAGRVPQPGELITVSYRRRRRSVARGKDAAAELLRASLGLPGLPQASGHVVTARSTADCVAAAQALLAVGAGATTGRAGEVEWYRGIALDADVQPGDLLQVGPEPLTVQAVTIIDGNSVPELLRYTAGFAQSRARSLDFALVHGLADDAVQPVAVTADTSALPVNLPTLQVLVATDTALQIDSGVDPPVGGGFEVRSSDANFGSGSSVDLVLRSPVRGFSVPRTAFAERFFVRMYDGAVPPRYSAVSSMVLTSLPVS